MSCCGGDDLYDYANEYAEFDDAGECDDDPDEETYRLDRHDLMGEMP